jgi:threonine aldolase
LKGLSWVRSVDPVDTNIVVFSVDDVDKTMQALADNNIRAVRFRGPKEIRMVTHLDFTDDMLDRAVTTLRKLSV